MSRLSEVRASLITATPGNGNLERINAERRRTSERNVAEFIAEMRKDRVPTMSYLKFSIVAPYGKPHTPAVRIGEGWLAKAFYPNAGEERGQMVFADGKVRYCSEVIEMVDSPKGGIAPGTIFVTGYEDDIVTNPFCDEGALRDLGMAANYLASHTQREMVAYRAIDPGPLVKRGM